MYLNSKTEHTASAFSIVRFSASNVAKYSPILNEREIIQDVLHKRISYSWNGKEYLYPEQKSSGRKKKIIVTHMYDMPVRPKLSKAQEQRLSRLNDKL